MPETQKCVNFVNFVNNWQKCQCRIIVNMQLRWFFSTFIAFFSDFVHFTLKLLKILYYLCTAIQNHRTFIALSSHTRTRATAMSPAGVPVVPVACGCSKRFQDPSVSLMRWKMVAKTKNNFGNFVKFCSFLLWTRFSTGYALLNKINFGYEK